MPVTYIPGSPNQTPDQIDPRGLVQLAVAVHQQKQADAQQKRQNALELIKMVSENPDLATMVDHKKIEGAFKDAGMDLASADQVKAMQNLITSGGGASAGAPAAPPPAVPVPGNQLEQLGNTMQGSKAGAQSATPPSDKAAAKAPGGGVTPGGIVTPGTGQLQELQAGALDSFSKQVGSLAPLYMGAASQKQQQFLIGQKQQEIHHLFEDAQSGSPTSVRSFGILNMMNGHNTTAADITAMLTGNNDPVVAKQAMDYSLGNETGGDKAKRLTDTVKTLSASTDFMGKLKDPTDLPRIAQSIVDGHGVPMDLLKRPFSLNEIKDMNGYEKQLIDQGFDPVTAHNSAEAQSLGVPYTMSLPPAMQGLTIQQQEAQAKGVTAEGAYKRGQGAIMEGQAALQRVQEDHDKITKDLDEKLKEKLENYIMMEKNGISVPQELKDELLTKVAAASGISVQRVSHWYNWMYMGSQLEASGEPSKGALAGQEPGAPVSQGTQSPRRSHGSRGGVTPDEAGRIRGLIKSTQDAGSL